MELSNKILSDITVYMKYAKYGKTLHDERTGGHKDLGGYLNDIQEELMDAILYIQAARDELAENKVGLPYYINDINGTPV